MRDTLLCPKLHEDGNCVAARKEALESTEFRRLSHPSLARNEELDGV
jgi:hypothetical protein